VHILLATDADWIVDEVTAVLGGPHTSFTVCRDGRVVAGQIDRRPPDVAIFDLQVGSMGGMAITMSLRLDESAGTLPHVPVVMLLDRQADVFLAQRSGAEGWLVKPIDALRLQRAVVAVVEGGTYTEGVPAATPDPADVADSQTDVAEGDIATESPGHGSSEEEPATAG
jgi:DNA-binding response OmpR family regulator